MRLAYNKYTRATRPRWVIEEAGLPVDILPVDLAQGEHRSEEYRRIHPLGKLPALLDGDTTILESLAIVLHLADLSPGLAPLPGTRERAVYYQWCVYAAVTLEGPVARWFQEQRKPEAERSPQVQADVQRELDVVLAPVAAALVGREYLLGGFTAADIMIASVLAWADGMGLLAAHPEVRAYVDRNRARPAFARARS
jgi:glutathione S-transferase